MDKDNNKRKIDLMKSILTNKELSKTFKEAMSSPIGSTKRQQVKSIVSIMNKVGGVKSDGQGGPVMPPAPQKSNTPDYSNLMIFPAVRLKAKAPVQQSTPQSQAQDGQGGAFDYSGKPSPYASMNFSTSNLSGNSSNNVSSYSPDNGTDYSKLTVSSSPKVKPSVYAGMTFPTTYTDVKDKYGNYLYTKEDKSLSGLDNPPASSTKTSTAGPSNTFNQNATVENGALSPSGSTVTSPSTATSGTATTSTGSSNISQYGNLSSKVYTPAPPIVSSPADKIKLSAQSAVDQGTGPGLFAKTTADEKFGGGIDQYIADLDEKLKKDFNLTGLENELTTLKNQKKNFIPTLTQYVQGKDEYLGFINEMIDQTEAQLLKEDMGNPAVANSYNNYLSYLYTLKGRQNQRYGNFLDSAITEYNTDVENTQSHYDNVYKRYSEAITRQGTIAQNEYNNLYNTMADLYTNLEEAPNKLLTTQLMQQQLAAARTANAKSGLQTGTLDEDYYKNLATYSKDITDSEGGLDFTKIPNNGLTGFFEQNYISGGSEAAMTEAIRRAIAKTLELNQGDQTVIDKVKKLNDDFSKNTGTGASNISSVFNTTYSQGASKNYESIIEPKISDVQTAVHDLVTSGSGFLWTGIGARQPGLKDKNGWINDWKGKLGETFLEDLYTTIANNVSPDEVTKYSEDPNSLLSQIFQGATDKDKAKSLAYIMSISS